MKQFDKSTRVLIFIMCLLFIASPAWTQTINASKSGPYCPGETVTYDAYCNEAGTYNWSVTNGKITGDSNTCSITVKWDNTTSPGSVALKLTNRKGSKGEALPDLNATTITNILIKSVNNYTPKAIEVYQNNVKQTISSINGNNILKLDWCEGKTYTLFTKRENFPNTTTPIDWYIWQLPPGWQVVSNNVNHLGNNRYETASNDISVVPLKGDGGNTVNQIKVQAYSRTCNWKTNLGNLESYVSNEQILYIDREPRLEAITASKTIVNCADKSPFTISVPALPGASYYTWTLPPGWVISGSSTGNIITVIPSGTGAGQVSVSATFTCSNPAKTVNAKPIEIGYSDKLKPVELAIAPTYICYEGTTISANSPGATSYTWTTTGGMLINGLQSPVTTTSNSITVSLPTQYTQGPAQISIVANNNTCGNSEAVTQSVWMNVPAQPQTTIIGNPATINLYLGEWTQVSVTSAPGANFDQIEWKIANRTSPGTPVTGLALNSTDGRSTSIEALEPGYYYLMARSWNNCGNSLYYYIDVNVTAGGGGAYMVEAAPNPVSDYIDVKVKKVKDSKKGDVNLKLVLYNNKGKSMLEEIADVDKNIQLDVRKYPEGLYYLHLYHSNGIEKKQIIIKR